MQLLFIVEYGAEYLTCLTSGGGTQQMQKTNLLDVPIPFPTTTNHLNLKSRSSCFSHCAKYHRQRRTNQNQK